jgi:hypothetical protein
MRPIFSLAAAAADVQSQAHAQAKISQSALPAYASAPLPSLYQPQNSFSSHSHGASYGYSSHSLPSAPSALLPDAHTPSHAPPAGQYIPRPFSSVPPSAPAPPSGGYSPYLSYHSSGAANPHAASSAYLQGPGAPSAPQAPHQYYSPLSRNTPDQSHVYQSQQPPQQYAAPAQYPWQTQQGAQSQPLHEHFAQMNMRPQHAGSQSFSGYPSGPHGPTFATLMGLAQNLYPSASAPISGQQQQQQQNLYPSASAPLAGQQQQQQQPSSWSPAGDQPSLPMV